MHIAQPALSQQVAALEAELGKKLLMRTRHGVTVTPAGRALYVNAQTLLRQLRQLESEVKSAGDTISGHVTVGLPVSCAAIFTMPFLATAREQCPQVLLQISENLSGLLGELLLNNRLDIAMLYATPGSEGLMRTPLLVEKLSLVTSPLHAPPGEAGSPVEVALLAQTPLVLPSHTNGLRALVDAAFAKHGLRPLVVAEIDSLSSLKAAAELGFAATILPRSAANASSASLDTRELIEPSIERTIVLCRPTSAAPSTPVEAIETLIVKTVNSMVSKGAWTGVRLL